MDIHNRELTHRALLESQDAAKPATYMRCVAVTKTGNVTTYRFQQPRERLERRPFETAHGHEVR